MAKLGTRQNIIIGVMVIALLYAAFNLLAPKNKASAPDMTQKTAELNAFVTDLTARTGKDTTRNLNALIFSRAEKEWTQNPFLDAKSYRSWSKASEEGGAVPEEFNYTGYLEMGRKRIAIINGIEYKEGEPLDIEGFVLKSVSPARVVIENRAIRSAQTVSLQE